MSQVGYLQELYQDARSTKQIFFKKIIKFLTLKGKIFHKYECSFFPLVCYDTE